MLAACGGKKPPVGAEVDPVQLRRDFSPAVGTARADVEAVLGAPTWTSLTKNGEDYALYQIEGAPEGIIKGVVYAKDGTVLHIYR